MNAISKTLAIAAMAAAAMTAFSSCEKNGTNNTGSDEAKTMTVDATDYTKWVYVNLSTGETSTAGTEETPEGFDWHIAIHRYDIKTNGAEAVATESKNINDPVTVPESGWTADSEGQIIVDMSDMMNGNIIYAKSSYNEVLSRWLNLDTSTMPPIYTMSNKIYILRLQDNTHAAIHLLNYMNEKNVKGHMTFEYLYPLEKAFQ